MRAKIIGLIIGILATPVALFFAVMSAGGGHGNYFAARLLFPLSMLASGLFHEIIPPLIVWACVQYPLYGWLAGAACRKEGRKAAIITFAVHGVALAVALLFPNLML